MAKEEVAPAGEAAPASPQVHIEESNAVGSYANFCRVTGTPEELIIDFGLNAQPFSGQQDTIEINQRLIVNFYTAKRMLHALGMAVQRHEQAFGVLETDVQKRLVPQAGS